MGFNYKVIIKCCGIIFTLLLCLSQSKAQVCNGTLGNAVFVEEFGQDLPHFGPPVSGLSSTTYVYKEGTPSDGQYTIAHSTAGLNQGWHQNVVNRTINGQTPNTIGYIMIVNASYNQDIFFQTTIKTLCPNTTYEFSAYIINILKGSGIKPNIKFSIENNGVEISPPYATGDIAEGSETDWKKYGTTFTTPANLGVVTLKMTNINPGGSGNDLALDDITFRPCGPSIDPKINNVGTLANLCVGDTKTMNLSATLSSGYNNPQYQWQELQGNTWVDLDGENAAQASIPFINATAGTNKYRLATSEFPNIESKNCRTFSPELTIVVSTIPTPTASNSGTGCVGGSLKLDVDQGITFNWTGPNGFTSKLRSPTLTNLTTNDAGIYTVTVANEGGCTNTSQTEVKISPAVVGTINLTEATICEGIESVQLEASGGITYNWLPTIGLSDPTIANPIASPLSTTVYTVTISNGQCETTKEVKIIVLKKATADAGADKKLLLGQAVTLKGIVGGDNINYFWTPSDYLDDPTKLNPIATPTISITYTLHVESECNISSDEVFVKVYPKVEIPNAFTPNGDGINDTWTIPSIVNFPNPKLIVVNRYGQIVFEGYKEPVWDGKQNGKDVPSGTYYYTLFLNNDEKIFTGWVLITR